MDEFGVLTERYGLKPQGKSAPMATIKRAPVATAVASQSINVGSNPNSWSSNSAAGGLGDHLDNLFVGSGKSNGGGGSSFGYDSIFSSGGKTSSTSSSANYDDDDDIFGLNKSTARSNGGVTAKFPAPPPPPPAGRSSPVGDLLGGYHDTDDDIFGGIGKSRPINGNATAKAQRISAQTDELIPGFGSGTSFSNGYTNPQQSTAKSTIFDDPLSVFESSSKPRSTSGLVSDPLMEEFGQFSSAGTVKDHSMKDATASIIDELEIFAMAKASKSVDEQLKFPSVVKKTPNKPQTKSGYDFESSLGMGTRSSSTPKSRTTSVTNKEGPGTSRSPPPTRTSSGIKKASSSVNIVDDLADMFGDASVFGEFTEVEGESEERRRARLGRQTRTQQRMAQALAEKNERDYQTQQEQEEKSRVAENLEANIKRWAAGKEGNMRALLSSLQYVLWPECGWESVSLTDLITSTSVKKVYRRATLCVHPDKVQQKGATIQQKYTAEKVFDILKEAYKKFETDELR